MGSDLGGTTAPDVAGETTSPWEHIAEASFSTATVPPSKENRSTLRQADFIGKTGAARQD
jgi:hypothetical protein